MKAKRKIIIGLLLVMLLVALAGCGNKVGLYGYASGCYGRYI